jgi:hypothetical protein
MSDKKANATEKIVLPKSLQREMIKFFAQAIGTKNVSGKDNKQTPEIPKKGALIVDKHRHLCKGFHRGAGARRIFNPGARRKVAKLRKN